MTTTVLLMRHGKAKELAAGQQDFDRELTEAGKRSLAATMDGRLALLDEGLRDARVWASPAARAKQTADVLARSLGRTREQAPDVEERDYLWLQDSGALFDELRAREADTVVVVGHNPMMEELAMQLAGARIPFATGAVACLQLDGDDETAAEFSSPLPNESGNRLLWFSQGPISQNWRTMVKMERTIAAGADAVQARLEAFLRDPDDIETMHKFRVSIRTLRSLLAFVRPWQDAAQNERMQQDLKAVVAATSRLRELDVLGEQAREMDLASDALAAFCDELAAAERARVIDVLASRKTAKRLERVRDEAHALRWRKHFRQGGLPARVVRGRFDAMAEKLDSDLSSLDLADVEPTHDVRKDAKRVRYAAENFAEIIGEDAIAVAKGMTAHQDNLGAVCDARVNIDIINGLATAKVPEPVAWDLALLRAQNETFLYTTLRESRLS